MKIAIVAPSPVPFTIGGAENLFWGLLEAVNQLTPHQAELIKLPSAESDFPSLISSYEKFSQLDLSHFDAIISTKYPAWMVRHERHICYLQHRLRGLYDTYPRSRLSLTRDASIPEVKKLLALMNRSPGRREVLEEVFGTVKTLMRTEAVAKKDLLAFPGPLSRTIIHFLDGVGLSPGHIEKYAAISHNVANRADYFPPKVPVAVAHHPSNLKAFQCLSHEYLFTASRLDCPKRLSLLIDAMRYVRSPIQLKIAGTGPDEVSLKRQAAADDRIDFLGFINDNELADHYAHALAVPFFPFDEDYGLITIEAMMSGKPVLTTRDAGGPNEFVTDFETGFSVPPEPEAIAEKIDYFAAHRDETIRMGDLARQRVQHITWQGVINTLFKETHTMPKPKSNAAQRKKLTVALTFPVFPPRGGGQSRVFHLYRCLATHWDVELVTFANNEQIPFDAELVPGLREIRVPKSREHIKRENRYAHDLGGVSVGDVTMPMIHDLTPEYTEALAASASKADVLVASHPYLFDALRAVSDKPLWYEAHNVEWLLKKDVLPDTPLGRELLQAVYDVEKKCCAAASVIMTCSASDAETLCDIYGADADRMVCVPNGVDLSTVHFRDRNECLETKRRAGLAPVPTACFMGAWHPPNLDAVNSILSLASKWPSVLFLIYGSVSHAVFEEPPPDNVKMLGVLDDAEKSLVLELSDLALNPMRYGSGTNLKMLDYFAAGVPVLSSPFGARGLAVTPGENVFLAELDEFHRGMRDFLALDPLLRDQVAVNARQLVETRYDWRIIAENFRVWLDQRQLERASR